MTITMGPRHPAPVSLAAELRAEIAMLQVNIISPAMIVRLYALADRVQALEDTVDDLLSAAMREAPQPPRPVYEAEGKVVPLRGWEGGR